MPATPTITLSLIDGAIRIDTESSDTPDSIEIWRSTPREYGGASIRVAIGLSADSNFDDYGVAAGLPYSYFAKAITSGVAASSTIATETLTLPLMYLHAVDKRGTADNVFGDVLALYNQPTENRDFGRQTDVFNLSGRGQSVVHISKISSHSLSCLIRIPHQNVTDRDTLLTILESGRYLCLRNQDGLKLHGILRNAPLQIEDPLETRFQLQFEETSYNEHIRDATGILGNLAIGSYTSAQVELALFGENRPPKYRCRVELQDKHGNTINDDYQGLIESESSLRYDSANDTPRTGTLTIREEDLALDAFESLIIDADPEVYLRLGEGSGNFADSSGNSRTFTANGTITYGVASLTSEFENAAITPNGTTGYLSINDAAWMDVSRVTISMWVKGTATNDPFWYRDDGSSNRFIATDVNSNGQFQATITFTTGTATKVFTAPGRINDGQMHNVVVTYDGSFVRLYIDGLQAYAEAETRTLATGTLAVNIGRNNANTRFAAYTFDEISFFSRALTPVEIRQIYKKGSGNLREVDFLTDTLKPYIGILMDDGGYAEFSQGVYTLRDPKQTGKESGASVVSCAAFGKTIFLNDATVSDRYVVASSTNVITAVTAAIVAAGFTTAEISLPTTTLSLAAAREWDKGTSYLVIINDLLAMINFEKLRDNENGIFTSQEYVQPILRSVDRIFADDEYSLIIGDIELNPNLVQAPNQITVVDANPGTTTITSTETSDAWSNSASTGRQGSTIEDVVPIPVVNQTVADSQAARLVTENTETRRLRFATPLIPIRGHRVIYTFSFANNEPNVLANFLELSDEMPLSFAGLHNHNCKEIVNLNL